MRRIGRRNNSTNPKGRCDSKDEQDSAEALAAHHTSIPQCCSRRSESFFGAVCTRFEMIPGQISLLVVASIIFVAAHRGNCYLPRQALLLPLKDRHTPHSLAVSQGPMD
jgi:hypothetical protein